MPDSISGLPLHPLVVHAVVVLLPLAAAGVVALVLRPALRPRFGVLVVAVAVLAALAVPVATSTGESLAARVGEPHRHAELGDSLIAFAVPLALVAAALTWGERVRPRLFGRSATRAVMSVLAVVVALAAVVQVYRVGESGARAVWGTGAALGRTRVNAAPSPGRPSTSRRPEWAETTSLTSASPSP